MWCSSIYLKYFYPPMQFYVNVICSQVDADRKSYYHSCLSTDKLWQSCVTGWVMRITISNASLSANKCYCEIQSILNAIRNALVEHAISWMKWADYNRLSSQYYFIVLYFYHRFPELTQTDAEMSLDFAISFLRLTAPMLQRQSCSASYGGEITAHSRFLFLSCSVRLFHWASVYRPTPQCTPWHSRPPGIPLPTEYK